MIRTDATLDASAGTVTFTDPVEFERIQVISNLTADGVLIYNFADGTGTLLGLVLALTYDTSAMADTDVLTVYYGAEASGEVTVIGTVPLPTGAATSLRQDAQTADLDAIKAAVQGTITTDGSGHTQPVSGAVTVTGVATAANQTTANGSLASIDAGTPAALGSTTSANSQPVVVASDQAAMATKVADGANVTIGTTTDAGVVTDTTGTVIGFLRGLVKMFAGGTAKTQISNGTQSADTSAGDAGQNALKVAPARKEVTFTTTTVQALATTDVSDYRWVSVQIALQGGSSTVTFQTSNDNINWTGCILQPSATTSTAFAGGTTAVGIWHGPIPGRFFRINVTGIISGTTAGTIEFYSVPTTPGTMGVVASAAGGTFADGGSNTQAFLPVEAFGYLFNGTTWDRVKSATASSASTGTGLLGVGNLLFDGTNWQVMRGDVDNADGIAASAGLNRLMTIAKNQAFNGTTWDRMRSEGANADAVTAQAAGQLSTMARGMRFNGTTWDRYRGNTSTVLIAAGTTTTQTDIALTNHNAQALLLAVNIASGAGSIIVAVNGTTVSAYKYNLLTSGSLTGVAVTALQLGPGIAAAAGLAAATNLPRNILVTVTVTGTISYGVDAQLSA